MKQYQIKQDYANNITNWLNEQAEDDWELFSICGAGGSSYSITAVMVREVPGKQDML